MSGKALNMDRQMNIRHFHFVAKKVGILLMNLLYLPLHILMIKSVKRLQCFFYVSIIGVLALRTLGS